ncbi:MAG: DoxX family protein [Pirellulales bacterium]|nr:DoxX family protein [Pirellulales bacterium]
MSDNSPGQPPAKLTYWLGWVVSLLPVPILVMGGIAKFQLTEDLAKNFESIGWPTSLAMLLALLELGSLALYLIPRTAVLGAILLTGYLGGAIAAHIRVEDFGYVCLPLVFGILFWLGLYLRDPQLRQLLRLPCCCHCCCKGNE